MALKEQLKHFSSVDNYSSVMTKADYDSNMDILADEIDTKVNKVISLNSANFQRNYRFATIDTADSTETIIYSYLNMPVKTMFEFDIKLQALQDDYSTKWIAVGTGYATIADDGTIATDINLTDVWKDDTDWAFSVSGNNGDSTGGASVDFKVTGKDSTNIKWGLELKVHRLRFF